MERGRRLVERARPGRWGARLDRDRVADAALLLSGNTGPLREVFDRARVVGLGERVLKTALAAGVGWGLGRLAGIEVPLLATLTAMFTIELTLAQTVMGSRQRIAGLVVGLGIALVLSSLGGARGVTIGVGVLLALMMGIRLRLDATGIGQVASTCVLALAARGDAGFFAYAWVLSLNTAIGMAVGVALNLLVAPPTYTTAALAAVRTLAEAVATVLDELAVGFEHGITPAIAQSGLRRARAATASIQEAQRALERADESVKYHLASLAPERTRGPLMGARRVNAALEHAAIQARVTSRSLTDALAPFPEGGRPDWLLPEWGGRELAATVHAVAGALRALPEGVTDPAARERLRGALASGRAAHARAVAQIGAAPSDRTVRPDWVLAGEVCGLLGQMLHDLGDAADALWRVER